MPGRITWESWWSIRRRQEDDSLRTAYDQEIGFVIENHEAWLQEEFQKALESYSIDEMEDLLAGAPVEIVLKFIHKLPLKSARKIVKSFRLEDALLINKAWQKPAQIQGTVIENG